MGLNEIIARHKKHLTNAQVHSLVKLSNEYKQLNAGRRAEAHGDLYTNHQDFRRGLQNMGLASRRGNIISGREVMGQVRVEDAYHRFNDQLNNIEDRMTENAANRMRAQNVARQQRVVQPRNFVDNLADQVKQQYAAKKEFNENAVDPRIGNMPKPNTLKPQVQTDVDPRFAQPVAAPDKEAYANYRRYTNYVADQKKQKAEYDKLKQFVDSYGTPSARDYLGRRQVAEAKQKIEAYESEHRYDGSAGWLADIEAANKITTPKTSEDKEAVKKGDEARTKFANAYADDYKADIKQKVPASVQPLLDLDDDAFNMQMNARKMIYERAQRAERATRTDTYRYAESDYYNGIPMDTHAPQSEALSQAAAAYAPYEAAAKYRQDIKNAREYARWLTYQTDATKGDYSTKWIEKLFPSQRSKKTVIRAKDYDESGIATYDEGIGDKEGGVGFDSMHAEKADYEARNDRMLRFRLAEGKGYDASEYDKEHGTGDSLYSALVNEYSIINGDATSDYNIQTGKMGEGAAANRFFDDVFKAKGITGKEKEEYRASVYLAYFMTDDEKDLFNNLYETYGAKKADEYFEFLRDSYLSERAAEKIGEIYKHIENGETAEALWMSIFSTPINLYSGLVGTFDTLINGTNDPTTEMLRSQRWNGAQNIRNAVTQRIYNKNGQDGAGKWLGMGYNTLMSMADSTTVALISHGLGAGFQAIGIGAKIASRLASSIGGALLGGSAFNATYEEGLQRGLAPDAARLTALGSGVNEMLFEALSIGTLLEKTGHAELKIVRSRFVNSVVNMLVQGGVEGSEEVFTSIANWLWDDLVNKHKSEYQQDIMHLVAEGKSYEEAKHEIAMQRGESLWNDFLGGLISGIGMAGGAQGINRIANREYFSQVSELAKEGRKFTSEQVQDLKSFEYKNKDAQELAQQKTLTNDEIGTLAIYRTQELVGQSIDVVNKAQQEGRISQEVADIYKRYAENGFQTKDNPNGVTLEEFMQMNESADVIGFALEVRNGIKGEFTALEQQRLEDEKLRNEFNKKPSEERQTIFENAQKNEARIAADPLGRSSTNTLEGLRQQREHSAIARQGREMSAATQEKVSDQIAAKTNDLVLDGNTVVTGKGSGKVTFDFSKRENGQNINHNTLESMTETERATLRLARMVAASTRSNIKIESEFTGRHKKENGYYNPLTRTLHINLSGEHSAVWVMSHELTHHLQTMNEQAYNDLRDAIKKALSKEDVYLSELDLDYDRDMLGDYLTEDRNLWQALNALEDDRYDEEYNGKDRAERVEEEVVARCCESFLRDSKFVRQMAEQHYRSAREITRFLKQFAKDVSTVQIDAAVRAYEGGYDTNDISPENNLLRDYADIEKIADLWVKGLREIADKRAKAKKATGEVKAAIMDKNGYQYVQTSRNVITGNDSSKWGQQVTNYINNEIRRGHDVTVYTKNGVPLTIAEDTAGKAAFRNYVKLADGSKRLMTDAEYAVKLRAESHIDELAKVSRGATRKNGYVPDDKGHIFAKDGFDYREAYFLDGDNYTGDNYYLLTMSVGKNGRINTIYNVGRVQKTDLPTTWGQAPTRSKTETEDAVSNNSIHNANPSVKGSKQTKASISDREYLSLARKYESGDKSAEAELRKQVDAAAKANGYVYGRAYHGTDYYKDITVFKRGKDGYLGSGIYFSDRQDTAQRYANRMGDGGKVYGAFLKINNPLNVSSTDPAKEILRVAYGSDRIYNERVRNQANQSKLLQRKDIAKLQAKGYDGIIWKLERGVETEYSVFDPSQVKSADLVTYDNDGNIIPLSERFNENEEDIRRSIMDKDFRMTKRGNVRTFEQNGTTANVIGSSVELQGGSLLNRVRMLQNLAEEYGSVTVTATSEKEAQAFEKAGAKRETDAFSNAEHGTWVFEHTESKYEKDTQYDAKQKRNFANTVLKEVGTRKNFTQDELRVFKAKLEKAFAVLHNATFGKGDQLAAYEYADKLFDSILNRYSEMSEADADMREAILAEMPRTYDGKGRIFHEIEVTEGQMAEIKHAFGSVAAYNQALSKALGTRVYVKQTENAKTLEDIFASDSRFDATTNEGDMPVALLNMAQETVGKRTNPLRAESQERTAAKEAMFEKALSIVGVEKSAAQKVREAVKEARAEERVKAKDNTAKAVSEARLAERMHEGAIRAQERRASAEREVNIKRTAANREAKLKEITKQKLEQQKTEQLRRDVKRVALKWNQRLVKMLANPTEASHIPIQLAQEVAEFTKALTEYIDSGTERGRLNLEKIKRAYEHSFADESIIAEAKAEDPHFDPRGLLPVEYDKEGKVIKDETLIHMIDALNEVTKDRTFKDLSAHEMRMLLNTVRAVGYKVYEANRMIGTEERKAIWKVGSTMVNQLEATHVSKKMRGYLETSLDLRRIAKIFSNSDENAEFVKLVDQLNKGAIEKERVAQVLKGMFDPLTQQYGDEIRKWYGKNAEWIDTGIVKNGKKVEITKGMRVSLAMHVLNEGNMRHIENGGITIPNKELYAKGKLADAYANGTLVRLNASQIDAIISQMTEAEKAYVETAKEFFHKRTGYYVNKTSLQLLGYRKATVDNYFPIHTDRNYTKSDFASVVRDGSIEGQGFLKERVMASNPVYLEDITSVVNRQIKGVSLYAGLAVPMRNFNAVMNASVYEDDNGKWSPRTTVRKAMTQSMGDYGAKVVQGFLQDVSGMSAVDVSPAERAVAKLQTRYVKAVLLANLKVTLKQAASYPTAAAVIPWKYLNKALLKGGRNYKMISRANVDLINQYTPLYQMRREDMANEITTIMAEKGLEQKMPWLLGWITKMDVATVGRLWSACEYMVADQQKNLQVGSDAYYKAVAEVFNKTIQQTQPNFTPLQRNAALRAKNPVVRTLTLFGTQRMQNGGLLIEAFAELKNSKGKSKEAQIAARNKVGRVVASQLIQNAMLCGIGLIVDALRGRMRSWQDKDKEVTVESIAKYMGDQFLGNIFGSFLGGSEAWDFASTLYKRATGGDAYDTEFTIPALDALESIIGFMNKDSVEFVKYMTGDHTSDEKLARFKSWSFKLAKAGGYATGLPIENLAKTFVKGWIPALQDIADATKTGELNLWLHQSGKLDKAKTAANYKEWTNEGFKGSTYFYWENKMKDVSGGREGRIPLILESDLTNEQKAMLLRMFDTSGATSEGTVVFKKNGKILIDFANPDGWEKNLR